MGEEEKGLVTLYADGKPVFSGRPVEPPTMELAEVPELPAGGEVMDWNKTVTLEGTIDMESLGAVVESIKQAWGAIGEMFQEAAAAFTELWRATAAAFAEDWLWKKAIAWAEQNRRDLAGRYHHTKKRRIRKKYRKRIVEAYLKEVSSTVSEYTCGKPEYAMYQDGDYCPMETREVEDCEDCYYGVKKEEAGE